MKATLTVVISFYLMNCLAQTFEKKFRMTSPFQARTQEVKWVNADNDTLLDLVVTNVVQNEIKLTFLKNQGNNSFSLTQTLVTGYQSGSISLTDLDNDNKIDIVISGINQGTGMTEVFLNKGFFNFQKSATKIKDKAFSEIAFADLNNDGTKDFIAGDTNELYIFSQINNQFILQKDTAISIRSLNVFDFDNNGFHDIAFSGHDANNQPTTGVLYFKNKFKVLGKTRLKRVEGTLESGDINHDGFFDLVVAGIDSSGASVIQTFLNLGSSFTSQKIIPGFESASAKIADFSSDGKADIVFLTTSNNIIKTWIKTFDGDSLAIPALNLLAQNYGDYDFDGDLDIVQLRSDSIVVFNNSTTRNDGPSLVAGSIGVQLYDRMFFYWRKSVDDHTDSTALTYDLAVLGNGSDAISPEFDQTNLRRLLVSHGNTGTANYAIQRLTGNYSYQVQSIDNSFAVQTKLAGGRCSLCADVTTQELTLCSPDAKVQLKPHGPKAMWFSFNRGFLGIHDSLTYSKSESDTIFSFNPSNNPCSTIKLFPIKVASTDTLKITKNIWNCENSQNVFKIADEWLAVTWKNNLNSTSTSGNQLTVVLQSPVVFNAIAHNAEGCSIKETFNLKISKPELKIDNNQYQIAKGGSVQLNVSGSSNYSWSPSEGLNDTSIASPIASPLNTTLYTVTAKDSIGCTSTATISVEVMEAGFIPTLFTPNGDGKNDALKIFGLSSATNFRFIIYNREGSVVYETRDVATAVYQGWSGITNGQTQPTGTYFWKVEGDYGQGGQVTLNGKKSGAFLLVR